MTTNGDLLTCERIGTSPPFGNILTGIDMDKLRKFYVNEYAEKSLPDCSKCWAIRLCQVCYAGIYSKEGLDLPEKRKHCKSVRESMLSYLSLYYSLQETNPDKLEFLEKIEVS